MFDINDILFFHSKMLGLYGGLEGVRDLGILESALAQPWMTFDGVELYPTLAEKIATLGFSIICNHPFFDGNKRTGYLAMDVLARFYGYHIQASVDEAEQTILEVASGTMSRELFTTWVTNHLQEINVEKRNEHGPGESDFRTSE